MPSEEFDSAAAAFRRTGEDAVTHARRVAGTAKARTYRHHSRIWQVAGLERVS